MVEFSYKNESCRMVVLRCIGPSNFFLERVLFPSDILTFMAPNDSRVEIWGNELYGPKLEERIRISADNQDSHESFCSEKSINYTLLSDPEGIISDKYGSWIPPFSDRNTFLITPEGEISHRWISVLPINHAKEVLYVLKKKI